MCKRVGLKPCKNCKVIPAESMTTQYRLMVMNILCRKKRVTKKKNKDKEPRIG